MAAGTGLALAGSVLGRTVGPAWGESLRRPGSLPHPSLPPGTDTMPRIEHIIVLMMENHSYDCYLGMLGRGPGEQPRGDGFGIGADGRPLATCPDKQGRPVRAYHSPTTCQDQGGVSQSWDASHTSLDGGRNDGFVRASSNQAMAYWTGADLPFYYGLASTFPICDRYFCSTLCQTYPNRRYLMAGTSLGMVGDPFPSVTDPRPPNGTIFDKLNAHGISWKDYFADLPTAGLFPYLIEDNPGKVVPVAEFFADAAAGTLPAFSLVDPESFEGSEENPQDITVGESYAASVINAVLHSPAWEKTVLVFTYDEHGGYYDHVPPPRAVPPDLVPPEITVPPDQPGGFDRYGFRVPTVIVSPWARRDYVSSVVHDHTSILKLVETKWNLPALTYRDANASNLLDCLQLSARRPPFAAPPELPAARLSSAAVGCVAKNPPIP